MSVGCAFKDGDGTGGSEEKLDGEYDTAEECVNAVLEKKPEANGVTYGVLGDTREKECFAEFKMEQSDGNSKWKSCILRGKIINIDMSEMYEGEYSQHIPWFTKNWYKKRFIWAFIACTFSSGDGTSKKEEQLDGEYDTAEECVNMVLKNKPDANGVTYGVLGDSREKECFAEFEMVVDKKVDSKWKSCVLI